MSLLSFVETDRAVLRHTRHDDALGARNGRNHRLDLADADVEESA